MVTAKFLIMKITARKGIMKKLPLNIFITIALLVLLCMSVFSQGNAESSSCINFVSMEGKRFLRIVKDNYSVSGQMPLSMCELGKGTSYRLYVNGGNFEERIGNLNIGTDGKVKIEGVLLRVLLRDAILPGWGSLYKGHGSEAVSNAIGFYSFLYKYLSEQMQYHHLHNRYDVLLSNLYEAESYERKEVIQRELHKTSIELNVQNDCRKRYIIASLALYSEEIISTILTTLPPNVEVGSGGRVVRFSGGTLSKPKTILLSLLRPGRGQFYMGKQTRGMLFSFLTTVTALSALEFHSQYDWAVYRYNMAVEAFNSVSDYEKKKILMEEAEIRWDDVERLKLKRNVSYIALAAVWGLNVVDAIFTTHEKDNYHFPISFESSINGAYVTFRF